MKKTVAVIGGTGLLGKPVSEEFAKAGYQTVVISRNAGKSSSQFNPELGIEFREADIFNHEQLKEALKGVDAIHLNMSGYSPESYRKNHIDGTKAVLAAKDESTQLISMISTASAYSRNDFRADTAAKVAAEQLLAESDVDYLAYLPSWFYETLYLLTEENTVTTMCDATQKLSWVNASEYAKAVVESYGEPSLYNRRLTLLGPEKRTLIEAADEFAKHMGYERFHMNNEESQAYAEESKDEVLIDAVELLKYTEKVGENPDADTLDHPLQIKSTMQDWLQTQK